MLKFAESRCPKCDLPLREERAHYRCENCGIVEACCEAICEQPRRSVEDLMGRAESEVGVE